LKNVTSHLIALGRGEDASSRIDAELETALRENIKITNELITQLKDVEGANDICGNLTLLSALRNAEDIPPSVSRAPSVGHSKSGRDRQGKRKLTDTIDDRDSMVADSPASASPKVVISQKDRLVAKSGGSRAGSVPAAREASAKLEDDKDESGKGKKKRSSISSSLKKHTLR
jgi:SAGA-associated factor 29